MILASMEGVAYGYGDVPCLEDASLEIHVGEFVAVTGPNGASKTTLLKLLLGLRKPWHGKVRLSTHTSEGTKLVVSYVPQHMASFNGGFPSTVMELVRSGRIAKGSWLRKLQPKDHQWTEKALREVGMWEHRKRKIGELSGGQKQRVCLARALAQEPDLLVLDEPATGMDAESRLKLHELLHRQVKANRTTVVMVTHNLDEVQPYLDRTIELARKENGGWKCCTTTLCSGHFSPVG